ncbi:acyl-ACP thioesterase [Carnobacteriaceae bacterium zg-84]|uniref:acyl-[acyl-carrier-protein] thioesterase n=1 Tax=Granulicatella sp. zg-84 TaxID=2678503 RepID=UPI0013C28F75|nr:acyl-ACP thioesterase domain-containing protein [Granulicatella sp. zg-84]NEW66560.1 acyl-ACP thioesterase [Granulicatella sp. zg-84]QMI85792.1 acyl-ACP thioesterase [Carnobacteriaceae bacterium zg-84]
MGKVYRESFEIKNYEVDRYGKLSISMLIRLLLHVSGKQTNLLYDNQNVLKEKHLSWFILQHDLSIKRLPNAHDVIDIETEPVGYNQFFTYRTFKVYHEGELIIQTMIRFAMVDLLQRKMVRIVEELLEPYGSEKTEKNIQMTKLTFKSLSEPYTVTPCFPRYVDIDENQHINNAVYMDFVMTSIQPEFLMHHQPKQISIVYDKEMTETDVHVCYTQIDGDVTRHCIGDICRLQMMWEKIKL